MVDLDSLEIPLTECEAGEEGEVVSLDVDTTWAARLREMGIVPGAWVRVIRNGSPLMVEVGPVRLCLRGAEASRIRLRPSCFPGGLTDLGVAACPSGPAGV